LGKSGNYKAPHYSAIIMIIIIISRRRRRRRSRRMGRMEQEAA
jgi:hypothetical protein